MALDLKAQAYTKAYRQTLESMSEKELRAEGAERGIPEANTIPLVTLREAIAQDERDRVRAGTTGRRQVATGPGDDSGHPGT